MDQVCDDFGVGLAFKHVAHGLQLGAQFVVVFDDAVVDQRNARLVVAQAREMRMGVVRGRHAVRLQVGGRGADQPPVGRDLAGDQAGVGQVTETHRDVERVLHEVGGAVGQLQLQRNLRIFRGEFRDGRRDIAAAEAQRRVDLQQTARARLAAGDQLVQIFDFAQDAAGAFQVDLAFGREAQAPRAAVEQAHAQARLDLGQPLADRGRRDIQFPRSRRHAAGAREFNDELQLRGMTHEPATSIAEVLELQGQVDVGLLQQRDGGLQIVTLFAASWPPAVRCPA
ncbi:hypothetical protein G6F32_013531 [Rhizopus arrhizus]|nr:hypothetical protein G6F32_013531 [Rhizopus arrhizus]